MTRRRFVGLMSPCALGLIQCAQPNPRLWRVLHDLEAKEGLALMESDSAGVLGVPVVAYSSSGEVAGQFARTDLTPTLSVSSDSSWIAWVPNSSRGYPFDENSQPGRMPSPVVLVTNGVGLPRTIQFRGSFATDLSLSSSGKQLVLIVAEDRGRSRRLVIIDLTRTNTEGDLTGLVTFSELANVERLRISGSGRRIAAGSRDVFVVIDVPTHKIVLKATGRFPSLSPDGERIAFVDDAGNLLVRNIGDSQNRTLLTGTTTDGVGAWSPDGKFVLVGVRRVSFIDRKLAVVEISSGEFVEVMKLGGWFGDRFVWINKRFLSA